MYITSRVLTSQEVKQAIFWNQDLVVKGSPLWCKSGPPVHEDLRDPSKSSMRKHHISEDNLEILEINRDKQKMRFQSTQHLHRDKNTLQSLCTFEAQNFCICPCAGLMGPNSWSKPPNSRTKSTTVGLKSHLSKLEWVFCPWNNYDKLDI